MQCFKFCKFLFIIISIVSLFGCGSNPEEFVKSGTLDFDTSVSVGDALDGYGYFSGTKWASFEDAQKRKTVEFEGTFDMEKFLGCEFQGMKVTAKKFETVNKKMPKDTKWSFIAQFAISKDKETFSLKYSGIKLGGTNLKTGKYVEEDIPDNDFINFEYIYNNEPVIPIIGLYI